MSIKFLCEHCHNEVTAPDDAAGKQGKCPFCSNSMAIPAPISEDDIFPMAPVDEEEERRLKEEEEALWRQDVALLDNTGDGSAPPPLEQRADLSGKDLRHFAINYCLDMANSNLERAPTHAAKLKGFGAPGRQAVEDLMNDAVMDPALSSLPEPLVRGFLKQLIAELK